MSCKAVYEVVLAPVRLIGDDHDVFAFRKDWIRAAFCIGQELLYGSEYDTA